MKIYLIRHTSVAVAIGTCYGRTDVDVGQTFEREAEGIKKYVRKIPDPRVFSSPLKRCVQLAETLSLPFAVEERLIEADFGDWEMMQWRAVHNGDVDGWFRKVVKTPSPGGESMRDLHERVVSLLNEKARAGNKGLNYIFVTHAGVIRSAVSHVLGLSLGLAVRMIFDYGSLTLIEHDGSKFKLRYLNCVK